MSRLFESFEELENNSAQRLLAPRQSFAYAIMAAFLVGAYTCRILTLIHTHRSPDDLFDAILNAVLWLMFGVLYGRGAWRRISE
jgi:hypothetical protein